MSSFVPELTIIDLPSFRADPKRHGVRSENVVAIDFARKIVLIGGSYYAGEMKKSVFTTLNYYLPEKGVMPMHCSANVGPNGDTAIFFGLSGTGKTTLSADPKRTLIGDDEHGWGAERRLQFRRRLLRQVHQAVAGSRARDLCREQALRRRARERACSTSDTREPDFDDGSKTENTRSAYPLDFIPNASRTGRAPHPKNLVMLAADAFGVLPPIAKLTPAQAMYHFLSGYTAKVAGTERGLGNEPQPEFSTCFGSPFLPRDPSRLWQPAARADRQARCRLLAGQHRLDRRQVRHRPAHADQGDARASDRSARRLACATPISAPTNISALRCRPRCRACEPHILDPIKTWKDKAEFDKTARALVGMFQKNFAKFESQVDADVRAAAPEVKLAAE